jgi:hypothetical protein
MLGPEYKDILSELKYDGSRRAEELSVLEWCALIKCYETIKEKTKPVNKETLE